MKDKGKFMLITVCDRDILTERFPTLDAAQEKMKEEFESVAEVGGEFELNERDAYVNDGPNHADFDWLIVDL